MKIILLQDVPKVGKRLEVKEVADGHAMNFLLARGLAKQATKEALEWLEMQRDLASQKAEESLGRAQEIASQLDDTEIPLAVKVGQEGQLFEGVGAQRVVEKLKEMGYDIKKTQVRLEEPIKELGEFPVKIALDHNLEVEVRLIITEEN